ncbi:hypothetical protein [Paracoccus sp. MKU1]|uniref:hypothetical protein n=1 Tax=Paracoccus sp. MKU1 TaxID=1745182 RepID=UPI000719201C|nr:hypothetical protein [Paracoccus sp. MKU1]KRW93539.1 hypothetical protein AQY21_24415 [Paracoccus sp. MKU1]
MAWDHTLEIGAAAHCLAVVILAAPTGRIEIEQHVGAVIAQDEVGPQSIRMPVRQLSDPQIL